MSDATYNGWTNFETWAVFTWLTNEEATYNQCRTLAMECRKAAPTASPVLSGIWTQAEAARFTLSDQLKELLEEGNPLADTASVYTDLLNAALQEVNWHELADAFLEE